MQCIPLNQMVDLERTKILNSRAWFLPNEKSCNQFSSKISMSFFIKQKYYTQKILNYILLAQ